MTAGILLRASQSSRPIPDVAPTFDFDLTVDGTYTCPVTEEYVSSAGLILSAAVDQRITGEYVNQGAGLVAYGGLRYKPFVPNFVPNNTGAGLYTAIALTPGLAVAFDTVTEAGQTAIRAHVTGTVTNFANSTFLGAVPSVGDYYPVAAGTSIYGGAFYRLSDDTALNGVEITRYNGKSANPTVSDPLPLSTAGLATDHWLEAHDYSDTGGDFGNVTRLKFAANAAVDLKLIILRETITKFRAHLHPSLTTGAQRMPPGGSYTAARNSSADPRLDLALSEGVWSVFIDVSPLEGDGYWIRSVQTDGVTPWTLPFGPNGKWHPTRARAWPEARPSAALRRSLSDTDYAWTGAFLPEQGATLDGDGLVTEVADSLNPAPGRSLFNDTLPTADEEDPRVQPVTSAGIPGWQVNPNQYLDMQGVTLGPQCVFATAGISFSHAAQNVLSAWTGVDDEYNDALQVMINQVARSVSVATDVTGGSAYHARTQPIAESFDQVWAMVISRDGVKTRVDLAIGIDQPKIYANLPHDSEQAIAILDKPGKTLWRARPGVRPFGPGVSFGVWVKEDGTFTADQSARAAQAILYDLKAKWTGDPSLTAATISHVSAGPGADPFSSATIAWTVTKASNVRVIASTSPTFDTLVYDETIASVPTTANKAGTAFWHSNKHAPAGLTQNTRYYYKLLPNGVDNGPVRSFSTFTRVGSTTVLVGSCSDFSSQTNSQSFNSMKALYPHAKMFMHQGDLIYANYGGSDITVQRRAIHRTFLSNLSVKRLLDGMFWSHVWDDHESGPNDNHLGMSLDDDEDGNPVTMAQVYANNRTVYGEVMPHMPLELAGTICQAWPINNAVYVIQPDGFCSRKTNGGEMTMYAAVGYPNVLDWMKAKLLWAKTQGYSLVVLSAAEWDRWFGVMGSSGEAVGFVSWVLAGQEAGTVPFVLVVSGDIHRFYADDGGYYGLPALVFSPLHHATNASSATGYLWGAQSINITNNTRGWGAITFEEDGSFEARFYARPEVNGISSLKATATSAELIPGLMLVNQTTRERLVSQVTNIPVARTRFGGADPVSVNWTTDEAIPQTGTVEFDTAQYSGENITITTPAVPTDVTVELTDSPDGGTVIETRKSVLIRPPRLLLRPTAAEYARYTDQYSLITDLPGATFARSGEASAVDSGGVRQDFATGVVRLTDRGIWFGQDRVQMIDPNFSNWTPTSATHAEVVDMPSEIGPDGLTGAVKKWRDKTTNSTQRLLSAPSLTHVQGVTYNYVVAAKAAEDRYLRLGLPSGPNGGSTQARTYDLLNNGAASDNSGSTNSFVQLYAAAGGWMRLRIQRAASTATGTPTGSPYLYAPRSSTGTSTYTGVVGRGILLAEANFYIAPNSVSLLPFMKNQETVAQEDLPITDVELPAQFTVIFHIDVDQNFSVSGNPRGVFDFRETDADDNNHFELYYADGAGWRASVWNAGVQTIIGSATGTVAGVIKMAVRRDSTGRYRLACNGALVGSGAVAALPPVSLVRLGENRLSRYALNGYIVRGDLIGEALTDAEMIAETA